MTGRGRSRAQELAGLLRTTGALATAVAATGGLATVTRSLADEASLGVAALTPSTLEAAVALAVTGLGTLAAAVLSVGCLLLVVASAARAGGAALLGVERAAARLTPRVLRRALVLGVGGLLVAGPAAAAVPDPAGPDLGWTVAATVDTASAPTTAPPGLGGAPVDSPTAPDPASALPAPAVAPGLAQPVASTVPTPPASTLPAPSAAAPAPATAAPTTAGGAAATPGAASPTASATASPATDARAPAPAGPTSHVVVAGESLWAVAAAHLGPTATDADIAAEWPRWYAANAAVVGDDPDLVLPGQVLHAPSAAPTTSPSPEEQP